MCVAGLALYVLNVMPTFLRLTFGWKERESIDINTGMRGTMDWQITDVPCMHRDAT